MEPIDTLNYHGRSKSCAQWVIDTFEEVSKSGQYANNKTMQVWIEASRKVLRND